jgi:hypothetical protein
MPCFPLVAYMRVNQKLQWLFTMSAVGLLMRYVLIQYRSQYRTAGLFKLQHEKATATTDFEDEDRNSIVWQLQTRVLLAHFAICRGINKLVHAGLIHLSKAELVCHCLRMFCRHVES